MNNLSLNNIGSFTKGGGAFTPMSLPNLKLWVNTGSGVFQDNAFTTPAAANDDPVGGWRDQSGNGNSLTQVDTARPLLKTNTLNGKSTILFDGTNDWMSAAPFTLSNASTVYFVGKQVTWTENDWIWDGNTADVMELYTQTATPQVNMAAGGGLITSTAFAADTFAIVTAVYDGASSLFQVNNETAATGTMGSFTAGGFYLGIAGGAAAGPSNIQVAEILIYSVGHNAAQRTAVKTYLNNKYAIF